MKNIVLNNKQVNALHHVAEVSGMDCWFKIESDGSVYDLESSRPKTKKNNRRLISQLLDGVSEYDFHMLSSEERYSILQVALKI